MADTVNVESNARNPLSDLGSLVGITIGLVLPVAVLLKYPATHYVGIGLAGCMGVYSGVQFHFGKRRSKPLLKTRRAMIVPRLIWYLCVGLSSVALSIALLISGFSLESAGSRFVGVYYAAASEFYFFGAVYAVAGWVSLSEPMYSLGEARSEKKTGGRAETMLPFRTAIAPEVSCGTPVFASVRSQAGGAALCRA